jgi:hypothetical protein
MPILTEDDIDRLIKERKAIPDGLAVPQIRLSEKNKHRRKDFEVQGETNRFIVKIRQSAVNPLNFSVILAYLLPGSYTVFRLRRYNGKSHEHSNTLEQQTFYDFHVHQATERYQSPGFKEDHYASTTNRFWNLESAVACLLNECGFRSPMEDSPLFKGQ